MTAGATHMNHGRGEHIHLRATGAGLLTIPHRWKITVTFSQIILKNSLTGPIIKHLCSSCATNYSLDLYASAVLPADLSTKRETREEHSVSHLFMLSISSKDPLPSQASVILMSMVHLK